MILVGMRVGVTARRRGFRLRRAAEACPGCSTARVRDPSVGPEAENPAVGDREPDTGGDRSGDRVDVNVWPGSLASPVVLLLVLAARPRGRASRIPATGRPSGGRRRPGPCGAPSRRRRGGPPPREGGCLCPGSQASRSSRPLHPPRGLIPRSVHSKDTVVSRQVLLPLFSCGTNRPSPAMTAPRPRTHPWLGLPFSR